MKKFLTGLLITLLAYFSLTAKATCSQSDVTQYVSCLLNQTFDVLNNNAISLENKKQKVKLILEQNLDTNYMAKSVLPRQITGSPNFKLDEFSQVYKQYLLNTYCESVKNYNGQKVNIKNIQQLNEQNYRVDTMIADPVGQEINVSYKVISRNNQFKIVDVVTENISLIKTQKDDFSSTIASGGMPTLISDLRAKSAN